MENQTQIPVENNQIGQDPIINQPQMPKSQSSVGSIIATIIIIALIILGGLYFWGKRMEVEKNRQNLVSTEVTIDETAAVSEAMKIEDVSAYDDLNTLEAELNATNASSVNTNL
jgi:hypothetical protein